MHRLRTAGDGSDLVAHLHHNFPMIEDSRSCDSRSCAPRNLASIEKPSLPIRKFTKLHGRSIRNVENVIAT